MSIVFQRKATHGGPLVVRPGVVAAAAITGLGLICGGAQATRLTYPTADNPYCDVTTYAPRDVPEQAMLTLRSAGRARAGDVDARLERHTGDRCEQHRAARQAGLWPVPHGA